MALFFKYSTDQLFQEAVTLLSQLIATPSLSKSEDKTADALQHYMESRGVKVHRSGNNVWAKNEYFSARRPTILLNSHHDTVKPNAGYTRDPYAPTQEDGKLYGLGSNDAGGALVSLLMTFLYFYNQEGLRYNLIFAGTAEEEISGAGGVSSILPELGEIHCGIVGEPTAMSVAIHEKGLMVLDCTVRGVAGHAARDEGKNAIYEAQAAIEWFRTFRFPKVSKTLGPVKMSVTMIEAGTQHNVIPDTCKLVVDVRTVDTYTNDEILDIIQKNAPCEVVARSTRLQPSTIAEDHELIQTARYLGFDFFGSATLSDQALMPFPTIKLGPGISERSHTANEFILLDEIREGVLGYLTLLNKFLKSA